MKTLEIGNLTTVHEGGMAELSATVRRGAHSQKIFFRSAHAPVCQSADPLVPAVLLPAMRGKFDLRIDAPLSSEMLHAASRVQGIESAWHPGWRVAKIAAVSSAGDIPSAKSSGNVGVFFSGGVDSFYTLQKHRQEITHLIFVSGLDVPLDRPALRDMVGGELRRAAQEIGLPLVEVETNLRQFSAGLSFSWEQQHGAALAAVAHFLAPGFDKLYIASSFALPFLVPFGSHPGLDPLWSVKSLELVHDGIEATRFDKIGALRPWPVALQNLRVCWQAIDGQYNCCRCRKCLWTMAFLRAHRLLDQARRCFPLPLDLRALSEQPVSQLEHRFRLIQGITMLERGGEDPELTDALRKALDQRYSWRRSIRRLPSSAYRELRTMLRRIRRAYRNRRALHVSG